MKAPTPSDSTRTDAVAKLCPTCGLCCNGLLFADVELQKNDDAKGLSKLGLDLFQKGSKVSFLQPCKCFDGQLCQIYENRPIRCRTFECRLLMRVQSGELTTRKALGVITKAREMVGTIQTLVRKFGNLDEHLPLNHRCAEVAVRPIDLGGDSEQALHRRRLMLAYGKLMSVLERDFLT